MIRAVAWVAILIAGFQVLVITMLSMFSKMKGVVSLQSESSDIIYALVAIVIISTASGLLGVFLARQQTLRNPEVSSVRSNQLRTLRYKNICAAILLSGAVTFLSIFSEWFGPNPHHPWILDYDNLAVNLHESHLRDQIWCGE